MPSWDNARMAMSPNPALLLHERLKAWQSTPSGRSTLHVRRIDGRSWQDTHLEAIAWILQVRAHMETDAALAGDDEADDIGPFIDELVKAVFVVDSQLNGDVPSVRHHISSQTLRHLRGIGRGWKTPAVPAGAQASLLETAHAAQKLVMAATHLDDDARHYLHELTAHLIKAVGDLEINGVSNIRALSNELMGALGVYFLAEEAPSDQADQAKGIIDRLGQNVKRIFYRHVFPAALEVGIQNMITSM